MWLFQSFVFYLVFPYLHLHLSLTHKGPGGTTDNFTTSFFHFSLFSTALWDLANSRPVHSLMLSSHLFLCLPCLLPPFTVPCRTVLARPDEWETMSISLQFASLYDGQFFMWSDYLLDLGTDFLVGNTGNSLVRVTKSSQCLSSTIFTGYEEWTGKPMNFQQKFVTGIDWDTGNITFSAVHSWTEHGFVCVFPHPMPLWKKTTTTVFMLRQEANIKDQTHHFLLC